MEMNKEQVVFKRSLKGMLVFIAGIIAFVLGGLYQENEAWMHENNTT